ncbi:MAG: hypothetical protein ACREV6_09825 [Clostridium sp.]|uniref:hypothetical protein n=1 Tax=Clostridium sp. TaxID=1506 RepID=UPI003D6D68A6
MMLPTQSKPISRSSSYIVDTDNSISPSGLCESACSLLPINYQSICKGACSAGSALCPTLCAALPMPFNMICNGACKLLV